jgi:hypothetical protein
MRNAHSLTFPWGKCVWVGGCFALPMGTLIMCKGLLLENEVWIGAGQGFLTSKDEGEERERNKEKKFVCKVVCLKY